ncbi:MAG: amino acid ABC transporter permease [Caldilineae bacterium]|nr:MAG: amino acid ABC transporter permease [Caldilineae bacterium]
MTTAKIGPPQRTVVQRLSSVPWWAVIIVIVGLWVFIEVSADETYRKAFAAISPGIELTLRVTAISYGLALVIGLIFALMRISTNPFLYAFSTLYVEVVRGLPMLVIILYAGLVLGPAVRDYIRELSGNPDFDPPMLWRAIAGLSLGYGAYLAEIFRAGIQSIGKGQMEAARSLGMTYAQAMRLIILPQAVRRILPPLGNDLIAMLKDSSLIAVLAVPETLQLGRLFISRTFRAFEGYNSVALAFLAMTLLLSFVVRYMEKRLGVSGH